MILQKLLFPQADTCSRMNMFYKGDGVNVFMEEAYAEVAPDATLNASTYFNSFSLGKWRKYTILDNLKLRLLVKGEFQLAVHHARMMYKAINDVIIAEQHICTAEKTNVQIQIPLTEKEGIVYFELKALGSSAQLWGGAYETEVEESALPYVKIGIGICTFRREAYVAHNMKTLRETILENPECAMHGHLEIFISDNSKTLKPDLATEDIHIYPNRNLGGAGGFTRTMIEAYKAKDEKKLTHILMMDDDVRLSPESLIKTYTMLRMLRSEYRDAFIGGHMLRIDRPQIQSEAADHWDITAHHPVKFNYDLEKDSFLIKNEIEDSVNYFGWWYCCMPINVISDNNLPLPIFIKRDDIEYGLRNGKTFITMNGICVWHEHFSFKTSSYLEYYYFRNMCIMNARHRLSFTSERLINEVWRRVKNALFCYRYNDAELMLLGVQHYLKGIDWLKSQDAEKLNAEVMKLGYKKQPVGEIDFVFAHGVYERQVDPLKLNIVKKVLRKLTFNGWLLPARGSTVVPAYQPSVTHFYRKAVVLNYEESTNTAFVTTRDYKSLMYILKMFRDTKKQIKKNYSRVTREYRDRYDELINIKFWNDYLFTPGEAEKLSSGLDREKRPKNTKVQRKELAVSRIARLGQALLFWFPVKKNRVMVYLHDRNGFTCNPKYIVKNLVELYGDKLEIIWVTMHPETCDEVKKLGVKVMKSNTKQQMLAYLRTRFFITNDAFPSWALHRPQQKWMNTWHAAMNYKHIGYDYLAPMSPIAAKLFKIKNRQPDFFLSGSRFFTEDTAPSFRLDEKIFVPCGLPRNDAFFEDPAPFSAKVRKHYNLDNEKRLAIFAPTFRRGMKSDTYGMDFDRVRAALKERFGGDWVILFRNHNFVKGKQKYPGAVDVSGYHDMQELMCAADVLISDYSSCLYDFCMTRRPSFVYATDLNNYMNNDRSFAYPFEKWPYPVATSNEELVDCILNFDKADFTAKVEDHLKDAGAYDKGDASKQVADIIAKYCL